MTIFDIPGRSIFFKYVFLFLLLFGFTHPLSADEFHMLPEHSTITASIRYTVLGRYTAAFQKISSQLYFDQQDISQSSVTLTFDTQSIDSGMPRFDRIVRSARLLDAQRYPTIQFQSQRITKRETDYWVEGRLDLHGVQRVLGFPFQLDMMSDDTVRASGSWQVNRKSFDIIWHPVLDYGGILVGNKITIDWQIVAQKNQ